MKVFISWSGEPSRSIASALHGWLGIVVQHVDPWLSDAEIESGTRWNEAIATNLEDTDFGLVCVTRSNQSAPWLMFEAGALAKRLSVARLVPLCIDLEPAEVISPLQSFQSRKLDKEGMRRIVHELGEMSENPKPREDIDRLFEAMWPELDRQVQLAATQHESVDGPRRSTTDMLAELVTRVRNLERDSESEKSNVSFWQQEMAFFAHASRSMEESVSRLSRLAETIESFSHQIEWLEGLNSRENRSPLETAIRGHEKPLLVRQPTTFTTGLGDLVTHPEFGPGKVVELTEGAKGQMATIQFRDGKIRRMRPQHPLARL
ncbi:toll/interleukin-1 receptor domain-containing protein [Micromonospora sp. DT41]|uniref:toll/interleukin-1 receptor domain-containing protein n=1 Tax=Micromonospora sp. DT41 TaxID=3393437 RepID=UPI003CEE9656